MDIFNVNFNNKSMIPLQNRIFFNEAENFFCESYPLWVWGRIDISDIVRPCPSLAWHRIIVSNSCLTSTRPFPVPSDVISTTPFMNSIFSFFESNKASLDSPSLFWHCSQKNTQPFHIIQRKICRITFCFATIVKISRV